MTYLTNMNLSPGDIALLERLARALSAPSRRMEKVDCASSLGTAGIVDVVRVLDPLTTAQKVAVVGVARGLTLRDLAEVRGVSLYRSRKDFYDGMRSARKAA